MTVMIEAPLEGSDKLWWGLSDQWGPASPLICIPVDQLDGMSKLEIGDCVLESVKYAHYAQALNLVSLAYASGGGLSDIQWLKTVLLPFKEWNSKIFDALQYLEAQLAHARQKNRAKATKDEKRREINRNYNNIFVALGRRDSFRCKHCTASMNLEIDHIIPLSKDGSNDLSNLQILCSTCNSKKGISVDGKL